MQRKAIATGALFFASIAFVGQSATAEPGGAAPVAVVDPVAEFSNRLEEMYGPNTLPLQDDTLQAVGAVLPQLGNLSPETLALFLRVDQFEESQGLQPYDMIRQGLYAQFQATPQEEAAFRNDMMLIFEANEALGATTTSIPPWLASGYAATTAPGGPWWILKAYVKWLYKQHKNAQELKKLCAARYQAYENFWRKKCESQPGCSFRVTGSGNTFCFWCDCPEPVPDAFGIQDGGGTGAPWKTTPGDFAAPFGKCLGKSALCGSN